MKLDKEATQLIFMISAIVWVLTVVYGGAIVLDNISIKAKLNALETVCKANLLRSKLDNE